MLFCVNQIMTNQGCGRDTPPIVGGIKLYLELSATFPQFTVRGQRRQANSMPAASV